MNKTSIYIGNKLASFNENSIEGKLINIDNEVYYKISNSNNLRPFFMSLISNSNHWMFISSNGALSAGRKNSDFALFPYYTDDKITESLNITGSKSLFHIHKDDKVFLWEPFSDCYKGVYRIKRNLYKNTLGNKIIFEELNQDLGVTFRYQWCSSNLYGFIKRAKLINSNPEKIKVTVLDGLQNILPYGVGEDLQNSYSNLVDAYKKSELQPDTGIGIYALSSIIVDKAEPSEALKANIVWSLGFNDPKYLLSSIQLDKFRKGYSLEQELDIKAEKGAYFICSTFDIKSNEEKEWMIIANVNQSVSDIINISEELKHNSKLQQFIKEDIANGSKHLLELAGASDAIQISRNRLRNNRHFSNTLFNIMRGGVFDDNYKIEKNDFINYLEKANKTVYNDKKSNLNKLPDKFNLHYIKSVANKSDDVNFKRLVFEYLPLKFSRRHGDPSRPWNKFSINTRSEVDGSKILDYEGNWRDIFQNWEALAHSYPEFIENMIYKFLNATTFDGYNPYRVTKDGFDWEIIEPDDPWSYIGYWGDHQIIYLLKFLEFIENHYPNKLEDYFNQEIFVYANVPYKIKCYTDLLKNPKDTIDFDTIQDQIIRDKRKEIGVDGALLYNQKSTIHKVNLIEKLLATILAKLSNFIPEGGIWLNTQRPEWNDANNALVGNGVSMVTLYYLRRFLDFFENILNSKPEKTYNISEELFILFEKMNQTFFTHKKILNTKISDTDRKVILDNLGNAASDFRNKIYTNGFTDNKKSLSNASLKSFLRITIDFLEHSIEANERADKLYHAYNLMTVKNDSEISISYLSKMLEGQVAILSSGYLSSKKSLDILNALRSSDLFRKDQYSYLLYPNKDLPQFLFKNNIPKAVINDSNLLKLLLNNNNFSIIEKDNNGGFHFNGNFNNADSLKLALKQLPSSYQKLVDKDENLLLNTFEEIFNHKAFTGRSGTFFGYEGLGSIYWHMVSKLLLAVQETVLKAYKNNDDNEVIGGILDHYYEINEGIGVHKSPALYGAFPTDPYSHTPQGRGAQQPGMTGQVKEDVLCRFGELGVSVYNGKLQFNPTLLRREEFLIEKKEFKYITINKEVKTIMIEKDSICFTYCQVPIIYSLTKKQSTQIYFNDGSKRVFNSLAINKEISDKIFNRNGEVNKIEVSIV